MPHRAASALVVLLSALGACAQGSVARAQLSPGMGGALELVVEDLQGRPVDVGAAQGLVRIVDFWATWCEPCREAMPGLDGMARELGMRGLRVYGVSFDEDRAQIAPFLKQVPVGFTILFDRGGARLADRFQVTRLPTTIVADRRGVIRAVFHGWTPARAVEERRLVEQLLDEQ